MAKYITWLKHLSLTGISLELLSFNVGKCCNYIWAVDGGATFVVEDYCHNEFSIVSNPSSTRYTCDYSDVLNPVMIHNRYDNLNCSGDPISTTTIGHDDTSGRVFECDETNPPCDNPFIIKGSFHGTEDSQCTSDPTIVFDISYADITDCIAPIDIVDEAVQQQFTPLGLMATFHETLDDCINDCNVIFELDLVQGCNLNQFFGQYINVNVVSNDVGTENDSPTAQPTEEPIELSDCFNQCMNTCYG